MQVSFQSKVCEAGQTLVVTMEEKKPLYGAAKEIDQTLSGRLQKAIEADAFEGKKGQTLLFTAPDGCAFDRLILLGLGASDAPQPITVQEAGGALMKVLLGLKNREVVLDVRGGGQNDLSEDILAVHLAYGALLRSWCCDQFKTTVPQDKKPLLESLCVVCEAADKATACFQDYKAIAEGVFLTQEVVTLPPNLLYPESYAETIRRELEPLGVIVEVYAEADLEKMKMGSLLCVGQGSARESQVVIMRWEGGEKGDAPLAFVGKGVTFDTGGISLKPSANMDEMKYDMAGSGTVVGLMKALAGRKAGVNVVGAVGLVENMPSGTATRPGDIVTSLSGQTIEVLNTDAEGRLVLADVLWYTQDRFKPKFMVNLATLTGAIVIALGDHYAGLFSNDDTLSDGLLKAGEATHEKLWRFPLADAYDKEIDSVIADMKNLGEGRKAGSITAAQFLQRFVNKTPWAHLDIAGMAWADKDKPLCAKGASGYGVRLLDQLVREAYEA